MKKPLRAWLVTQATTMVPSSPAAPSSVRKPSPSSRPEPICVRRETRAWTIPRFSPRGLTHRAVPAIFPPPKMWLTPCARHTAPTAQRRMSNPMSTALVISPLSTCLLSRRPAAPAASGKLVQLRGAYDVCLMREHRFGQYRVDVRVAVGARVGEHVNPEVLIRRVTDG